MLNIAGNFNMSSYKFPQFSRAYDFKYFSYELLIQYFNSAVVFSTNVTILKKNRCHVEQYFFGNLLYVFTILKMAPITKQHSDIRNTYG